MPKRKIIVEVNKKTGPRVKEAREKLKYSQAHLGYRFGYGGKQKGAMVSLIENGKRPLQKEDAEKLYELSGYRVEYLLGFDDYPTDEDLLKAMRNRRDFYLTWRDGFVDLIAGQLDYDLSETESNGERIYHFKDSLDRDFCVPRDEIMRFLSEYYEYARFRIEQIVDSHKVQFYKDKKQAGE